MQKVRYTQTPEKHLNAGNGTSTPNTPSLGQFSEAKQETEIVCHFLPKLLKFSRAKYNCHHNKHNIGEVHKERCSEWQCDLFTKCQKIWWKAPPIPAFIFISHLWNLIAKANQELPVSDYRKAWAIQESHIQLFMQIKCDILHTSCLASRELVQGMWLNP